MRHCSMRRCVHWCQVSSIPNQGRHDSTCEAYDYMKSAVAITRITSIHKERDGGERDRQTETEIQRIYHLSLPFVLRLQTVDHPRPSISSLLHLGSYIPRRELRVQESSLEKKCKLGSFSSVASLNPNLCSHQEEICS